MKKYIVKSTATGTKDNPNFSGETYTYLEGKGDESINVEGDRVSDWEKWWIAMHGYSRACDAKRNYTYNHPENTRFWTTSVEIVEYEV